MTSANASLPAARSSTGSRRQAGSTRKKVYATYCPATPGRLAVLRGETARQRAGAHLLNRLPDRRQARLRRVVRVEEARLPCHEVRLVADVEEEQAEDVRLTVRQLERPPVEVRLACLRDGVQSGRLATVRVEASLGHGDRRLHAELVVDDRQRRAGLGGAVECSAEQTDQLAVVGDRDGRRARVAERRCDARALA